MDLVLDGSGPVHGQLARALKQAIAHGRLPAGARLPASRELARGMGLSRATVVKVYEQLRVEGHLTGKVGSGTYVKPLSRRVPARKPLAAPQLISPQSSYARRLRLVEGAKSPFGPRAPGMRYAFRFSQPTVNPALTDQWMRELAKAAPYVKPDYPPPQGLLELRDAICRHIGRTRGVVCTADDVLVTAGFQQSLALICDVLVDPGDGVVVEEPLYYHARAVLRMKGAVLNPVNVDRHGLVIADLPDSPPKLIYVTPSHQCPTGAVLSTDRRMALLHYAERQGAWICEDDYDGEFRNEARPVEALQSVDRAGRVIYVGSFSKTLFPSLRLGYMVMPPGLREDFIKAKWVSDFSCPSFEQSALARFISNGGYDRHLMRATKKLAERRAVLREALRACCGSGVEISEARSGMHLLTWVRGADRSDGREISRHAQERGLALYPVDPFYQNPPDRAGFLMGFSSMGPQDIRSGVALFARCIDAVLTAKMRER